MDSSKLDNLDNIIEEYNKQKKDFIAAGKKITSILKELLEEKGIEFHDVNHRIKDEESLRRKFNVKNGKYNKLEDITDIIGVRVITYYSDDIDRVAQLVEEEFDIDEENSIDKRKVLDIDRFGYLSLHYIVKLKKERAKLAEYRCCKERKFEIQIRSILQHAWAEIEHDLGYKNDIETPREIRRDFYRLAGVLETADKEFIDIRNKISEYEKNIKKRIKNKEETIFIDKISLEAYVNNDVQYRNLVSEISKEKKINFYEENNFFMVDVQILLYMNYETINEVKKDINKNAKKIFEVSKTILDDDTRDVPRAAILLYLCYVKLAERDNVQEFIDFFYANNINYENEDQIGEFASKIINVCKKN